MPRATCHVSRVAPDGGVVVRSVCDGAGLHLVAVALSRAVLALELVATLHLLCLQPARGQYSTVQYSTVQYSTVQYRDEEDTELPCLSIAVRDKVHADILADSLVHGPHFPGYEAEGWESMYVYYLHRHHHPAELKIFVTSCGHLIL